MWTRSFSKTYPGVTASAIWQLWADVNHWPDWDKELEYCQLQGEFVEGKQFILKPKGGPKVKITLSKIITNKQFTDFCKFIGATMYDDHQLEETAEGLRITNTISVTGLLSLIWVKLVAEKVFQSIPQNLDALVALAKLR